MVKQDLRLAIVEDNGVARMNLRNHLMNMGFTDIGCYSQGRELRYALKSKHFDLVLIDFHLGLNKNGVEVVQELQQSGRLSPTTGLIFITSDRMPLIFGQIVDVHPDSVLLKPYTIRNLEKVLNSVIKSRKALQPVYSAMEEQDFELALKNLDEYERSGNLVRSAGTITKLRARLLLKLGNYQGAADVYRGVLNASEQVIWARWGLVMALHLDGQQEQSMRELESMLSTSLTKDKACEWLARINIGNQQFEDAQKYMDQIHDTELSLSAARLKAYLFQIQDDVESAINLLERKRESNRHFRERFSELSMDLARVYLTKSELSNGRDKNSLKVARFLLSGLSRRGEEEDQVQKRNYIAAMSHILEGEESKALSLLNEHGMQNFEHTDISTLSDAVTAWSALGDKSRASEILNQLERKLEHLPDENEKTIGNLKVLKSEETLGSKKTRSLEFNEKGLALFKKANLTQAVDAFYQAHILFPDEPAFLINLLDAMVSSKQLSHKQSNAKLIREELSKQTLSAANEKRFSEICHRMDR